MLLSQNKQYDKLYELFLTTIIKREIKLLDVCSIYLDTYNKKYDFNSIYPDTVIVGVKDEGEKLYVDHYLYLRIDELLLVNYETRDFEFQFKEYFLNITCNKDINLANIKLEEFLLLYV